MFNIRISYNYELKNTNARMYFFNDFLVEGTSFDGTLIDDLRYFHILGAQFNLIDGVPQLDDFFKGFIYSWNIYQYGVTSFDDYFVEPEDMPEPCLNGCTRCPTKLSVPFCVSNCNFDEYIDEEDGSCLPCREDNICGCVREENLNLCHDNECEDCATFDEDSVCENCIRNAEPDPITGDCACVPPHIYIIKVHKCIRCHSSCLKCQDFTNLLCEECASSGFRAPDSIVCTNFCPSGFTPEIVDNENICNEIPGWRLCWTFNRQVAVYNAEGNPSALASRGPNLESLDNPPNVIYLRGLWFNGVDMLTKLHNF